ncbi:PREDICTED: short-chain dehydrogenase reductase 3b-like [Camelina sativa]|uniref:Short-chain dehydrogenase reductase 3b-like n=1 Tax=Camelina sativa TaxID=90675 RepID=A0ABM0YW47_CAMSA|nr:PREDICTED: short-chain dehydrogenase reductase 3b-like [Camelina sativa]
MSGNRLDGKIVIITGGASGIGAESVRLFTEHGARVVIVDVQDGLGQNLAASIGEDKASYYHCDVTNETEVQKAVKFTVDKHGKLDVLFSNAGVIEPFASILDLNLDELDRIFSVNLRGAAAFIKHAARAMVEKGTRGSIVCTTSVAAEISGTAPHGYTASKHGLLGLIKSASGGLGQYGIRVNGVAPFGVATPLVCNGFKIEANVVEENTLASANLKGIVLKARHVAEAALFLVSDESAYVSGQNLAVDGGYSVVKLLI